MSPSDPLPATFAGTRRGLHQLACYVIAPARLARAGEIGLRAAPGGIGTPPLPDGTTIATRGTELVVGERAAPITTLRDAAVLVDIALSSAPAVGTDLPPFEPDAELAVDAVAAAALGEWYALAEAALTRLDAAGGSVSTPTLWPEHFDLAVVVELPGGATVNVGFSPGDAFADEPYAYVGPWDRTGLEGPYWNAPFGAARARRELADADGFLAEGLALVRRRPQGSASGDGGP